MSREFLLNADHLTDLQRFPNNTQEESLYPGWGDQMTEWDPDAATD